MNISKYREAVVLGLKSIVGAAVKWRVNPLTNEVNRCMWGPWPWATLGVLTAAALGLHVVMPPFSTLIGFVPPLMALAFIPENVRELIWSAPAFFAFVVAWRVHRLRITDSESWPDRRCRADFGQRFFEAGALPVAVASLLLVAGLELVGGLNIADAMSEETKIVGEASAMWAMSFSANRLASNLVIVALVAGIMGVYRKAGAGLAKLLGAGFFVWGIHLGIAFSVPWMVSWWAYLPVVGQYAGRRSPDAVHIFFDVAVALSAWTAAREKCRGAPLWEDEAPSLPPLPVEDAESE